MLAGLIIFIPTSIFSFAFAVLFLDNKWSERIAWFIAVTALLLRYFLFGNINIIILNIMYGVSLGFFMNLTKVKEFVKERISRPKETDSDQEK